MDLAHKHVSYKPARIVNGSFARSLTPKNSGFGIATLTAFSFPNSSLGTHPFLKLRFSLLAITY
jgi:hypothetical protein